MSLRQERVSILGHVCSFQHVARRVPKIWLRFLPRRIWAQLPLVARRKKPKLFPPHHVYRSNVLLRCIHIITTTGRLPDVLLENWLGIETIEGSGSRKKGRLKTEGWLLMGNSLGMKQTYIRFIFGHYISKLISIYLWNTPLNHYQ